MILRIKIKNIAGRGRRIDWLGGGCWLNADESRCFEMEAFAVPTDRASGASDMRQRDFELASNWIEATVVTDLPVESPQLEDVEDAPVKAADTAPEKPAKIKVAPEKRKSVISEGTLEDGLPKSEDLFKNPTKTEPPAETVTLSGKSINGTPAGTAPTPGEDIRGKGTDADTKAFQVVDPATDPTAGLLGKSLLESAATKSRKKAPAEKPAAESSATKQTAEKEKPATGKKLGRPRGSSTSKKSTAGAAKEK